MSSDQPIRPPPKALANGSGSSSSASAADSKDSQETIKGSPANDTTKNHPVSSSSLAAPRSPQSSTTTAPTASALASFPHLGHYVFNLLATVSASPPRASQHPLSVSSSGESDGSDEDSSTGKSTPALSNKLNDAPPPPSSGTSRWSQTPSRQVSYSKPAVDKDAVVRQIVGLLDSEQEDEVKEVLRPLLGEVGQVG